MKSNVVIGGVIFWGDKVLILKRHKNERIYPGLWELPSGKNESGETYEQTLKREVREETGLVVHAEKMISQFHYTVETYEGKKKTTQINFLVTTPTSNVILSKEHEAFEWIDQSDLERYNISPQTKKVIRKAFDVLKII